MAVNYANPHAAGLTVEGTTTQDKLFDRDTRTRKVTIAAASGAIVRGQLLGKITTGGKYRDSLTASSDGSEVPDAIALHDVADSGADQEAIIAISGSFAIQGITFGASHTAASVDSVLRDKNIILENIVG